MNESGKSLLDSLSGETRDLFTLLRKWQNKNHPKFVYESPDYGYTEICDVTVSDGYASIRMVNNDTKVIRFTEKSTMLGYMGTYGYSNTLEMGCIIIKDEVFLDGDYVKEAKYANSLIRDYPVNIVDDKGRSFEVFWSDWYTDCLKLSLPVGEYPIKVGADGKLEDLVLVYHDNGSFTLEANR